VRRLLGALLIEPGATVSVDRLIDAIWPDGDRPAAPADTLRTYVARLRRSLEEHGIDGLMTVSAGYRLASGLDVDAARFEQLVGRARVLTGDGDRTSALVALDEALAMWTGPAFDEMADDEFAGLAAGRLDAMRVEAQEARLEVRLELGTLSNLVPDLERFILDHPLREHPRRLLMLALVRQGRQADAVRAYQDFRRVLGEETGLEPSGELTELERRIIGGDPTLLARHRRLRGYELGEKLGEGAFGEIYLARQPAIDREVAIKVVHPALADDPEFIQRFEAEAQLVARLEHPHVVPLYDFWREPGGAYLVMRYLRGGSAQQRLDTTGRFSLPDASRLVEEIGSALVTAHALGVIHRDIKPSNIIFDETGNSYLVDFGIAVESAGRRALPGLPAAGSPLYASPEQLRDGSTSEASDVYSFGVTIWELLAGESPFRAASTSLDELVRFKLRTPPPLITDLRPEIPASVAEVLRRATSVSTHDRMIRVV
jgi:DNA-binding SARP family transcriptional activator